MKSRLLRWIVRAAVPAIACSDPAPPPKTSRPVPPAAPAMAEAAVAPGPTAADAGDALVVGSIGDAINLIPFLSSDSGSHEIAAMIYNTLLRYDERLDFVPELADKFEVSADNLTFTFHLRKDVLWHDGEAFDAQDVLTTYHVVVHPDTPSPYAEDYKRVKAVEAVDPHTIRVSYAEPYAPALESWASLAILPDHRVSRHFDGKANRITESPLKEEPVGTGPFVFVEWKRQQEIVLRRNERYFQGPFHLGGYRWRVIADLSTMFNELRAGGIDMMGLTPQQYVHQTRGEEFRGKYDLFRYVSRSYNYLGFNLEHPLFSDKRARQAIAHAIHKKDIVDGVLLGQGVEATGPYVPSTRWHNPNVKGPTYDPAKARALLAESGWKDADGDGVIEKDGRPFSFTLITNAGNEVRQGMATVIQSNLRSVGIQVELRTLEWATFLHEFINKLNYDAFILGWSLSLDPDQYLIWHSSQIVEGGLNHVHFRNAEADRLLEEGRRTLDSARRQDIYWKFQEILAEEVPYVFLAAPMANAAVDKRFRGVRAVDLFGLGYSLMQNGWWVPQPLHLRP